MNPEPKTLNLTYTLGDLPRVAQKIIEKAETKTLLFIGEMGTGKTTLIKEIVRQLGSQDRVSSPTFSLVNQYQTPNGLIYHFDFHRLENEEEAFDMGLEEYVYSDAWKLMEWPQKVLHLLPENKTIIRLELVENNRRKLRLS